MKINDSINKPISLGTDKLDTTGSNKKSEKVAEDVKAVESVTLSPMSSQIQSLEKKVASETVFDAEKVEAIKSAIAGGQFTVNSEKVADGLIQTVKDLLSTKQS